MPNFQSYAVRLPVWVALLAAIAAPAVAQPVLSDSLYALHHPRLLFSGQDIPTLRAKTTDGGGDDDAYALIRYEVQNVYPHASTAVVLGEWYGLRSIPIIGLVAHLEQPPDATARDLGKTLTLYLADNYEPDLDEAHTGMRLRSLALGYDLFFADATESERAYIRDEIVSYLQQIVANPSYLLYEYRPYLGNHSAMFGAALGLASIALQGEADATLLAGALDQSDRVVSELLTHLFDPDGAYKEGVLYAMWTMQSLVYYFHARENFDEFSWGQTQVIRKMEEWLAYELLPQGVGRSHNLNDSDYATAPMARFHTYLDWATHEWNSGLSAWLWEHGPGPSGLNFGTNGDKAATVLWYQPVSSVSPETTLPNHRLWLDRGLYYYRSGWNPGPASEDVVFSFYSGKFHGGHAQEDQNQFSLYAYGERFVIDNGSGSTARRSGAHNMVLIDGYGQHFAGMSIGTDGRISEYLLGDLGDYVVGDASQAYTTHSEFNDPDWPFPGIDWSWGYIGANPVEVALRRVLLIHGGPVGPYIVVMDDIDKDGGVHDYEWRLHTLETNTVVTTANPITVQGPDATMDVHVLNPPWDSVTVWAEPFDNQNLDPSSTLIRVQRSAVNPLYAVALIPRDGSTNAPVVTTNRFPGGHDTAIEWTSGVVDRLIVNHSGGAVTCGSIRTDALFTLVREMGGVVSGYMAAGVTSLLIEGTPYVSILDGAVDCEWYGSTVRLDRADAAFSFYDTGITSVRHHDAELGFVVDNGFVIPGTPSAADSPHAPRLTLRASPNPFNPATEIEISGADRRHTRVAVYDVAGRRVRVLWNDPLPRRARLRWDGRDDAGRAVASGTYFLEATAGGESRTIKLTVLK